MRGWKRLDDIFSERDREKERKKEREREREREKERERETHFVRFHKEQGKYIVGPLHVRFTQVWTFSSPSFHVSSVIIHFLF